MIFFLSSAIRFYQKYLSSLLPMFFVGGQLGCRFHPSCSDYALQALRQYGLYKGFMLSLKRLSRCQPFSEGGYDPIP